MSDVHEELGYTQEKPDKPLLRIPFSPIPIHQHESDEVRAKRAARNLEFIFKILPEAVIHPNGMVSAEFQNKRFDFWPSSNCWYIHSTQKYGSDIERLCSRLERAKKES